MYVSICYDVVRCLPMLFIRSIGFSFETVDSLRLSQSYCYGMEVASQHRTVQTMLDAFESSLFVTFLEREQRLGAASGAFASWYKLHCFGRKASSRPDSLRIILFSQICALLYKMSAFVRHSWMS